MTHKSTIGVTLVAILFGLCLTAIASQESPVPLTGGATLVVHLVDPEKKAAKRSATVECTVKGLQIVDPAAVNEQPQAGQGHFHYQVDAGIVIATTAAKLSFHELKPGEHLIAVTLAANDHSPLGPPQTVRFQVPGTSAAR